MPSTIRSVSQYSAEVDMLVDRMLEMKEEDVFSYREANDLTKLDIYGSKRYVLVLARKRLEKEHNKLFTPVFGVGLRLMSNTEVSDIGRITVRRVRKTSSKGIKKMSKAHYEDLSPVQKIKHVGAMTVLNMYINVSSPSAERQIEQKAAPILDKMSMKDTIELLMKGTSQ